MPKLNVGQMLKDNGLELLGVEEDGSYKVSDADGNERKLNVPKMMAEMKLPKDTSLEVNSPDDALDASPVGMWDRVKLATGNTRGQVEFLKSKFQDVVLHPDNGLVVKNKGVWQRIDQDGLDPWELTKDVVEGVVGLAPSIVGGTIGATAGAVAGPVGIAAGAGVGGGAGEAIRTSLGRIAGTYKATPEEQMKDIGWEALLNTGGQALALGAKPALKGLAAAGEYIGKHANPVVKETLATVYGSLTGAGQTATRVLFEKPKEVAASVAAAVSRSGKDTMKAIDLLKQEQVEALTSALELAEPALRKKFVSLQDDLLAQTTPGFKADVSAEIGSIFGEMEKAGLGAVVQTKKGFQFMMNEYDDLKKLITAGGLPERVTDETLEVVGKLVKDLNLYGEMPVKTGKAAAQAALTVKRALSGAAFGIKGKTDSVIAGKITEFSAALDSKLANIFHDQGLGDSFKKMNAFYREYADVVDVAKSALKETNGPEILVNKLISNPGSQATAKGFRDMLGELVGKSGQQLLDNIIVKEGAKGHVRFLPNPAKLTPIVGGVGGAFAVGSGAVGLPAAAIAATQASPRMVMKQAVYANQFLDLMKGMSHSQRAQWLQKPEVVSATLRTVMSAAHEEDATTEEMLRQAGVK